MMRLALSQLSFFAWITLNFLFFASSAVADAPAVSAIAGLYTKGDVDSQSQLFILEDKTFCLTVMAGSLDLAKAGHWQIDSDGLVHLEEKRVEDVAFPVFATTIGRKGPIRVGINFDGSLSEADSPVFAMSGTDALPAKFHPIFPSNNDHAWSYNYALPLLPPDKVAYFFIGAMDADKFGPQRRKLRVAQYRLESFDAVRIGFNRLQTIPPLNTKLKLDGDILFTSLGPSGSPSSVGKRQALSPEIAAEVRERCITPVLTDRAPGQDDVTNLFRHKLIPIKTYELDVKLLASEPIFADLQKASTEPTDDISSFFQKEEGEKLAAAFKLAEQDKQKIETYLQLSKTLAEDDRFRQYVPFLLDTQFGSLMVTLLNRGDTDLARSVFNFFVEAIYPAVTDLRSHYPKITMSYVASSGLRLYGSQRDPQLPSIIFGKLLEKDFDIKTCRNCTLKQELASYYALTNDKQNMLVALRQALRDHCGYPEVYSEDPNFRAFLKDVDFRAVITKDPNFRASLSESIK